MNVPLKQSSLNCKIGVSPVAGGWCEWSEWTPCSRTCGAEFVSRYRSCGCPEPRAGGENCSGEQETHNGVGVEIQRQRCPVITFCPGQSALMNNRERTIIQKTVQGNDHMWRYVFIFKRLHVSTGGRCCSVLTLRIHSCSVRQKI